MVGKGAILVMYDSPSYYFLCCCCFVFVFVVVDPRLLDRLDGRATILPLDELGFESRQE